MTTFDQREKAFESRFAHDEELMFRAHARRDRRLGLWAAALLGKQDSEADEYAQALISAEIEGGGSDAVGTKLQHDFKLGNVALTEAEIRHEMDRVLAEALREIRTQ